MNKRKRVWGRRLLVLILSVSLLAENLPLTVSAEEAAQTPAASGCTHVHDAACGYVEAVPEVEAQEGSPCTYVHVHDGNCGYQAAVPEIPCDKGCTDTDGDGNIDHAPDCAYTPAVPETPCQDVHAHDGSCGYKEPVPGVEAVEGHPCGHVHDENCGGLTGGESPTVSDNTTPDGEPTVSDNTTPDGEPTVSDNTTPDGEATVSDNTVLEGATDGAKAVCDLIDALPSPEEIEAGILDNGDPGYAEWLTGLEGILQRVEEAAAAYDALNDAEKAFVGTERANKLEALLSLEGLLSDTEDTGADRVISQDCEWESKTLTGGTITVEEGVSVTLNGIIYINGDVTLNGTGTFLRTQNTDRAFQMFVVREGASLTIDGVTLDGAGLAGRILSGVADCQVLFRSGNIQNGYQKAAGGAVRMEYGTFIMEGGTFQNNQGIDKGGALLINQNAVFIMTGGSFQNNTVKDGISLFGGGAIYNLGKADISGGTFTGNTAENQKRGGAVYNTSYGVLSVSGDAVMTGNSADGEGDGIFYSSQDVSDGILNIGDNVNISDEIYLDFYMGAKILHLTSKIQNPVYLTCGSKRETQIIADGSDYSLTDADMGKITLSDTGWYLGRKEIDNTICLTQNRADGYLPVTVTVEGSSGGNAVDLRQSGIKKYVMLDRGDGSYSANVKPDSAGYDVYVDGIKAGTVKVDAGAAGSNSFTVTPGSAGNQVTYQVAGETKSGSFADAVGAAAGKGETTITLDGNVTLPEGELLSFDEESGFQADDSVTIDLNGFDISSAGSQDTGVLHVGTGSVTIRGGNTAAGCISTTGQKNAYAVADVTGGSLRLENVDLAAEENQADSSKGPAAAVIVSGGSVQIAGGTVSVADQPGGAAGALTVKDGGSVSMESGTVSGGNYHSGLYLTGNGTANLAGGTLQGRLKLDGAADAGAVAVTRGTGNEGFAWESLLAEGKVLDPEPGAEGKPLGGDSILYTTADKVTVRGEKEYRLSAELENQAGTDVTVDAENLRQAADGALTEADKEPETDVAVTLEVADKTAQKPDEAAVKKKLGEIPATQVGAYLDITLVKTITSSGEESRREEITDTAGTGADGLVKITVTIPEEMRGGSDYQILRVHTADGKTTTEALETTKNGNELSFWTDKFSTYAIAYTPEGTKDGGTNSGSETAAGDNGTNSESAENSSKTGTGGSRTVNDDSKTASSGSETGSGTIGSETDGISTGNDAKSADSETGGGQEPKTGDAGIPWATISMIAGLAYLLELFREKKVLRFGITEAQRDNAVNAVVREAKKRGRFIRYCAVGVIFLITVFCNMIGRPAEIGDSELRER